MAATKKTKKPTKKAPKHAKKAPARPLLSADDKNRLLKPPTDFRELTQDAIEVWSTTGKSLRVQGRTRAELARLLKEANKASDREQALARKYEAKLAPLADARLKAHADVWQALLDLYAAVRSARSAPELQQAFNFLAEAFARGSVKSVEPT